MAGDLYTYTDRLRRATAISRASKNFETAAPRGAKLRRFELSLSHRLNLMEETMRQGVLLLSVGVVLIGLSHIARAQDAAAEQAVKQAEEQRCQALTHGDLAAVARIMS